MSFPGRPHQNTFEACRLPKSERDREDQLRQSIAGFSRHKVSSAKAHPPGLIGGRKADVNEFAGRCKPPILFGILTDIMKCSTYARYARVNI